MLGPLRFGGGNLGQEPAVSVEVPVTERVAGTSRVEGRAVRPEGRDSPRPRPAGAVPAVARGDGPDDRFLVLGRHCRDPAAVARELDEPGRAPLPRSRRTSSPVRASSSTSPASGSVAASSRPSGLIAIRSSLSRPATSRDVPAFRSWIVSGTVVIMTRPSGLRTTPAYWGSSSSLNRVVEGPGAGRSQAAAQTLVLRFVSPVPSTRCSMAARCRPSWLNARSTACHRQFLGPSGWAGAGSRVAASRSMTGCRVGAASNTAKCQAVRAERDLPARPAASQVRPGRVLGQQLSRADLVEPDLVREVVRRDPAAVGTHVEVNDPRAGHLRRRDQLGVPREGRRADCSGSPVSRPAARRRRPAASTRRGRRWPVPGRRPGAPRPRSRWPAPGRRCRWHGRTGRRRRRRR